MDDKTKLELIATLRYGSCKHFRRVNICAECRDLLERIVAQIPVQSPAQTHIPTPSQPVTP